MRICLSKFLTFDQMYSISMNFQNERLMNLTKSGSRRFGPGKMNRA